MGRMAWDGERPESETSHWYTGWKDSARGGGWAERTLRIPFGGSWDPEMIRRVQVWWNLKQESQISRVKFQALFVGQVGVDEGPKRLLSSLSQSHPRTGVGGLCTVGLKEFGGGHR